ncbi:MAG: PilZ domain-containing protein [bacterium]
MMSGRQFSRIEYKMIATFMYNDKKYDGRIHNLSMKGMLLETGLKIPQGEELSVKIRLSSLSTESTVDIKTARVVRSTEEGVALEFEKIELDSFILLRNIMIYNSGDSDKIDSEYRNYIKHRNRKKS